MLNVRSSEGKLTHGVLIQRFNAIFKSFCMRLSSLIDAGYLVSFSPSPLALHFFPGIARLARHSAVVGATGSLQWLRSVLYLQVLHEHFTRKIRSHRPTHADKPVTLHTRVQDRTEPRRGEVVSLVLARAAPVVERLDETPLVIARGAETGVGDVDGAAAGFAETSGVTDVDADSAVGRARGV